MLALFLERKEAFSKPISFGRVAFMKLLRL